MNEYISSPWNAVEVKEGLYRIHSPKGDRVNPVPVAVVDYHRDGHAPTRVEASRVRAKLIAAAPELLDASIAIFNELDGRYDGAPDSRTLWMGEHLDRLRRAIEKSGVAI